MSARARGGLFGRFFGRTVSEAAAFAAGAAIGPVLSPPLRELQNVVNSQYPVRPPDAVLLAQAVAQRQVDEGTAALWASYSGFGGEQFTAMVAAFDSGPGVAQAFELYRRGLIDAAGFRTALEREGIEERWIDPLVQLRRKLLSPDELANAVVQGFRGLEDAADDAELHGVDRRDFQTMVDVTGLPPGPETLLDWLRRGLIDTAGVTQGIREGHTKVKYVDEYLAARWQPVSAATYAELHLRGWISRAERDAGGALTGYTPEDMQRLFLARGRPATPRQVHIGYQRGGRLAAAGDDERETFRTAVEQSNIRPEWEPILWAQRYTYPSAFVLRGLAQAGELTQAEVEQILRFSGWEPTLARTVSQRWAQTGVEESRAQTVAELRDEYEAGYMPESEYRTALEALGYAGRPLDLMVNLGDARRLKRWREKVIDAIAKAHVAHSIDDATARGELAALAVDGDAADRLLRLWTMLRRVSVRELTPTQTKRAYVEGQITREQALDRLADNGYSAEDAAALLDS